MISTGVFESKYKEYRETWEEEFFGDLKNTSFSEAPPGLQEAMEYSLRAGGKRLRPVISLGVSELLQIPKVSALRLASALECLHTYSLVHDDLPALDNDDFRRGLLANHKKFGEDTAILVGDALQSLSFEFLSRAGACAEVFEYFCRAVGPAGMVGGQMEDMKANSHDDPKYLTRMHQNKTGKLFAACVVMPYLYSREENIEKQEAWALELGLLFQIIDDILDETSTTETLGKTVGKDREQNKTTFVSFYGLDEARKIAKSKKEKLQEDASFLFPKSVIMQNIAEYFYNRIH